MSTEHKPFIACNYTAAFSGHFATLWGWTQETDYGFYEPYETGLGRYATLDEAEEEGRRWAAETGIEFVPVDRVKAAESEIRSHQRAVYAKELRDNGTDYREALKLAREKFPY